MSLNTGFFPTHNYRRKQTTASYNLSFNNQQQHHHHASSLQSSHSSIESTYGNESFLPSISNTHDRKPYRRNDFANNHLFITKRKLAGIFLGQSTRNLQATSDLIHLFDQQEPRQKKRNLNKHKRQENLMNKTSPDEQDAHLSVVNLVMKPSYPSSQTRDPLSFILRHRRSQAIHIPPKVPRPSIDTINSPVKQNFQSTLFQAFIDENEIDDLTDNDNISDAINTPTNRFDSSLLCVKSIVPSIGPQHTNHHLLQHH